MDSWLPTSPHRMAASSHEETWRLHHPVGDLSLDSINLCEPVLLLQRYAKLLSLSGDFLLEVKILSVKFLLCLILIDWREVDLSILCAGKVCRQEFEKV